MLKTKVVIGVFVATMVLSPQAGYSDGGGIRTVPNCKVGWVYSEKKKKCVRKRSEIFPDQDLKDQGWSLAYAGKYEAAIELFEMVVANDDPVVLNGLGYSHRKLGKLSDGIAFYKQALAINPDYLLAREYLGEGFVAAGRINLAKMQLEEIGKRCKSGCKEYALLEKAIRLGVTSTW